MLIMFAVLGAYIDAPWYYWVAFGVFCMERLAEIFEEN